MTLQQQSGSTPMTELERKLEGLPLLPAVVSEVLSLSNSDDYFDRLLRLAECDPPFAVSVLRCANSASSAPVSAIVSLEQAVTLGYGEMFRPDPGAGGHQGVRPPLRGATVLVDSLAQNCIVCSDVLPTNPSRKEQTGRGLPLRPASRYWSIRSV